MNILLCEPEEVSPEGITLIRDGRAEHLHKVLKQGPGDTVAAGIIGRGRGRGEILNISRSSAELKIRLDSPPDTLFPLTLALGMVRPIQVRRILKSAAAFGIGGISFVPTALGENSYREASVWNEYRRYLVEGAAQGGICVLPRVRRYSTLCEFLEDSNETGRRLLFDLAPEPIPGIPLAPGESGLVLIGSERGWTEEERRKILAAGYELRSLGSRILTTESAAAAATALILREQGCI
jgi:16S rRNA (uracil1498-N3)-methyltransferase